MGLQFQLCDFQKCLVIDILSSSYEIVQMNATGHN